MKINFDRTHVAMAWRGTVNGDRMGVEYSEAPGATEAVKRLVEAHERLMFALKAHVIPEHRTTYLQLAIEEADKALAPFMETEEEFDPNASRSCATPENEETGT